MVAKKKASKDNKNSEKTTTAIGFVPDFSYYLERHYHLKNIYRKPVFVEKIGNILKDLLIEDNPAFQLKQRNLCKNFEKMNPRQDRDFFKKLSSIGEKASTIYPFYLSFGDNKYGVSLFLDPSNHRAYFLALDVDHKIRKWHGKYG